MKRKAIFLLYRTAEALLLPAILLYLAIRCLKDRKYFATLGQRFGRIPALWQRTAPEAIWFHAVSVGEVLCALPLLEEVRTRTPAVPVFLSAGTLAGYETAHKRAGHLTAGIFYAPLDLVWCVRRVLRRIRPSVLVILETEIWPNMIREAKRLGCGVMIANGRISDRAWPRYRRWRWFFAPALKMCDAILVQSDEMRMRYIAAGAEEAAVTVAGNLKYDFTPRPLPAESPLRLFFESGAPVWVAASTAFDEEDLVLDAQRKLAGWRLVIAPRKPERFDEVALKLAKRGLRWTRRSAPDDASADVLLLDSVGELSGVFEFADVVFMGGTIGAHGGHNILEPALFAKPVVAGPHLENFRDIERHFEERNALPRVTGDLAEAISSAAADGTLGARARAAALEQQGASRRTAGVLASLYSTRYPHSRPAQPGYSVLWSLAQLWRIASARDRARKRRRAKRLPVRVVSVGNITAGGTGKTPVTIELLRHSQSAGLLTRGHGRNTNEIVICSDETLPIELTGDEAQLYMRAACVPVGIGADRFRTGKQLLAKYPVRTLFLDDGFQHLQLERDFDLVAIDALNPFGGGHLLPLGRLREPLEGLRRASAFLITRSAQVANTDAIEHVLREWNPRAPVFRARTVARDWVTAAGGWLSPEELRGVPSVAFCGLGNPESFWRTLNSLGIRPVERYSYGDHHRYSPQELRRLARSASDAGATALLTTAKDAVNLCAGSDALVAPLKLCWLEIRVEIDQIDRMMTLLADSAATRQPGGTSVVEP